MYKSQNKRDIDVQKTREREVDSYFRKNDRVAEKAQSIESDQQKVVQAKRAHYLRDAYLYWRAPEFEIFERDRRWYFYVTVILLVIVSYAIFTNALIMAITFILIGMVGYIYIHKEPRILDFAITDEGIIAGREIYAFEDIKSFWIFYEEDDLQVISFHADSYLLPYIHVPIHDQDPVKIREILLGFLEEEKHEPGIMEVLDRILHL